MAASRSARDAALAAGEALHHDHAAHVAAVPRQLLLLAARARTRAQKSAGHASLSECLVGQGLAPRPEVKIKHHLRWFLSDDGGGAAGQRGCSHVFVMATGEAEGCWALDAPGGKRQLARII